MDSPEKDLAFELAIEQQCQRQGDCHDGRDIAGNENERVGKRLLHRRIGERTRIIVQAHPLDIAEQVPFGKAQPEGGEHRPHDEN